MTGKDSWQSIALRVALGVCDFREGTERASWWQDVLSGVDPLQVQYPERREASFDATLRWFAKSVAPLLKAISEGTGLSPEQVAGRLVDYRSVKAYRCGHSVKVVRPQTVNSFPTASALASPP